MAVKIIFFKFFGIAPSSAVFFTHENIGVDTKIAGLRHIHAELYQFEDIMGGQDGVVEKGSRSSKMSTQVVLLIFIQSCNKTKKKLSYIPLLQYLWPRPILLLPVCE